MAKLRKRTSNDNATRQPCGGDFTESAEKRETRQLHKDPHFELACSFTGLLCEPRKKQKLCEAVSKPSRLNQLSSQQKLKIDLQDSCSRVSKHTSASFSKDCSPAGSPRAVVEDVDTLRCMLQKERIINQELRQALDAERRAVQREREAARVAEFSVVRTTAEAQLQVARAQAEAATAANHRHIAREEAEELRKRLEEVEQASVALVRDHAAELKTLREQHRAFENHAYREIHERSAREEESIRGIRQEAEKTFNILEEDFKVALAQKEEQIKRLTEELKQRQRDFEEQIRTAVRGGLTQKPKNSSDTVRVLRLDLTNAQRQISQLKSQLQLADEKVEELTAVIKRDKPEEEPRRGGRKRSAVIPAHPSAAAVSDNFHNELPTKKCKGQLCMEVPCDDNRLHVKDMVRQLQERTTLNSNAPKLTSQTIEDLRAIDLDIERLRRQLEDRDRVICVLREELTMAVLPHSPGDDESMAMCTSPDSQPSSPSSNEEVNLEDVLTLHLREKARQAEQGRCSCATGALELRRLREREAALLAEAAALREQNDLMEFRILELEQSTNEVAQTEWSTPDASDSGAMSLPSLSASDDLTDDESPPTCLRGGAKDTKLTGVATVFPVVVEKHSEEVVGASDGASGAIPSRGKLLNSLQESGIFEQETDTKAVQTEQPYKEVSSWYEERLSQLQCKLDIYESEGEKRDLLLARRLERELSLQGEVTRLRDSVARLMQSNHVLEEERCEFEEAENDCRLQCQILEERLCEVTSALAEKEAEVTSLDRRRRRQDKRRIDELEGQLEEKEGQLEALLQIKIQPGPSVARHLGLPPISVPDPPDVTALKEKIEALEKTNQAFIKALENADQIWATQEEEYKRQMVTMATQHQQSMSVEHMEVERLRAELHVVTSQLAEAHQQLAKMESLERPPQKDVTSRLAELQKENEMLASRVAILTSQLENERLAHDPTIHLRVEELTAELIRKNKEISDLEVTASELREEVETLEEYGDLPNASVVNAHPHPPDAPSCQPPITAEPVMEERTADDYDDAIQSARSQGSSVSVMYFSPLPEFSVGSVVYMDVLGQSQPGQSMSTEIFESELSKGVEEAPLTSRTLCGEEIEVDENCDYRDEAATCLPTESFHHYDVLEDLPPTLPSAGPSERLVDYSDSEDVDSYDLPVWQNDAPIEQMTAGGDRGVALMSRPNALCPHQLTTIYNELPTSGDVSSADPASSASEAPGDRRDSEPDIESSSGEMIERAAAHLASVFVIRSVRRQGTADLAVRWDTAKLPAQVVAYQVSVNGRDWVRVPGRHSSDTILHNVLMRSSQQRLVICVHPLTATARLLTAATAVYPPYYP